jgi:hypothetical protein
MSATGGSTEDRPWRPGRRGLRFAGSLTNEIERNSDPVDFACRMVVPQQFAGDVFQVGRPSLEANGASGHNVIRNSQAIPTDAKSLFCGCLQQNVSKDTAK